MATHTDCDEKEMTEADCIREVYPRYAAMKMLARLMDAPLDTARHWLFRKFTASVARRRELALGLLKEMDEQDQRRAGVRRQLQVWAHAHGAGVEELGTAVAGVAGPQSGRLARTARRLAEKAAEVDP